MLSDWIAWIKSHRKRVILIIIIAFSLPLIIVHVAFKFRLGIGLLAAEWTAGDVISYIAGFEALCGTLILGVVAIKQTEIANSMNKHMLQNEQLQNTFERQPSIMLAEWKMELVEFLSCVEDRERIYYTCKGFTNPALDEPVCLITLTLINSSNIFLELKMWELKCEGREDEELPFQCGQNAINPQKSVIHIAPMQTGELRLLLDGRHFGKLSGSFCGLKLLLTNCMGERYLENVNFVITRNDDKYLMVSVNKYEIAPFVVE